jgi:hypothetical protein
MSTEPLLNFNNRRDIARARETAPTGDYGGSP